MSIDMIIAFVILIAVIIYQFYSRSKFEKAILNEYDKKFEEWKEFSEVNQKKNEPECKRFCGLVFKTGHKVTIEIVDNSCLEHIKRGKFDLLYKEEEEK